MSIEVKCIDTNKTKEQLKKCPKEVRDYVRSLEGVYKANQANLNFAIFKIKQLSKASEAKTSNESEVYKCPVCGEDDIFTMKLTHYKCRKCNKRFTN